MDGFEKEFIDFMVGVLPSFGLDPLSSRLVGMIFIEPGPVAMEDLAERTGYSLASLSNRLRSLENAGMVKRFRKPGTKKAFYFMEKDVYELIINKIKAMQSGYIQPAKNALPGIIERSKGARLGKDDKQKLGIIQEYYDQLLEIDSCLSRHVREIEKMRGR